MTKGNESNGKGIYIDMLPYMEPYNGSITFLYKKQIIFGNEWFS